MNSICEVVAISITVTEIAENNIVSLLNRSKNATKENNTRNI